MILWKKEEKELQNNNQPEPTKDQGQDKDSQGSQHNQASPKVIEVKEEEYKKIIEELSSYKDKYLRLYAEFDNARKRQERERIEFIKFANEGIILEFLNILDDLERSVLAAKEKHEDYAAFLKGVELVMAHIYEMLKRNDVKPIDSVGKSFDPHSHEVLMLSETDQHDDGKIIEEFQKGYLLANKVIRTAKVKVAKKIETKEKEQEGGN